MNFAFGFLLLDGIMLYRVTSNSEAGVLRGTQADGVLASPEISALAPRKSSSWQQSQPAQHKSVSKTSEVHTSRKKLTSMFSTYSVQRAGSFIRNMTLSRWPCASCLDRSVDQSPWPRYDTTSRLISYTAVSAKQRTLASCLFRLEMVPNQSSCRRHAGRLT